MTGRIVARPIAAGRIVAGRIVAGRERMAGR
jgi:hypothetical protein